MGNPHLTTFPSNVNRVEWVEFPDRKTVSLAQVCTATRWCACRAWRNAAALRGGFRAVGRLGSGRVPRAGALRGVNCAVGLPLESKRKPETPKPKRTGSSKDREPLQPVCNSLQGFPLKRQKGCPQNKGHPFGFLRGWFPRKLNQDMGGGGGGGGASCRPLSRFRLDPNDRPPAMMGTCPFLMPCFECHGGPDSRGRPLTELLRRIKAASGLTRDPPKWISVFRLLSLQAPEGGPSKKGSHTILPTFHRHMRKGISQVTFVQWATRLPTLSGFPLDTRPELLTSGGHGSKSRTFSEHPSSHYGIPKRF